MKMTRLLLVAFLCVSLTLLLVSCRRNKNDSGSVNDPGSNQGQGNLEGNDPDNNQGQGSSEGNENDGENNGDGVVGDDEKKEETQPEKKKRELNVRLEYCGDFHDGYAFVAYTQNGIDYGAIINTDGIVIYKTYAFDSTVENYWFHIGGGYFAIERCKDSDDYTRVWEIVDPNGDITATSLNGEFDEIVGTGDGNVLVLKNEHTVTEKKYLYGLIDRNGKKVSEYTSFPIDCGHSFKYLGDGIFAHWVEINYSDLFVYSSEDSIITCIRGVSGHCEYKLVNGLIHMHGSYIYDKTTGRWQTLPNGIIALKGNGVYETIIDNAACSISEGKMVDMTGDYLKIFDPSNNSTIIYTNYITKYIVRAECHGEYSIIFLHNSGISFFTVIDSAGKQMFEPIECYSANAIDNSGSQNFIFANEKIIYHVSGSADMGQIRTCAIIDVCDGSEVFSADLKYDIRGYSEGFIRACVANYVNYRDYSYYIYLNESGEQVLGTLYEYYE